MNRRLLSGLVVVTAVGVLAFLAFAWRPALPPIEPPAPSSFAAGVVAWGEVLANAGNCATCHTAPGGRPFAGGRSFRAPFTNPIGTIYSSNITPDPDTGIGRWSEAAFARAMREGVARDGSHLYPAFPFDHFAKLSEADVSALYAYLMSVPPVRAVPPPTDLPFPLNVRALLAAWKALYLDSRPFRADPSRSAQWNRGAYLVEVLTHCGACHTPRNIFGAEQVGHPLGGTGLIDGWVVPALDRSVSPARWTEEAFATYLRGGTTPRGRAIGPMASVIHGLAKLPDRDIEAMATYLIQFNRPATGNADVLAERAVRAGADRTGRLDDRGAQLFARACAACHDNGGSNPVAMPSDLGLSTTLWLNASNNFGLVVLDGVTDDRMPGPLMPPFRDVLSDRDIADIAAYLRRTRTGRPVWHTLEGTIRGLRSNPESLQYHR